MTPLEMLMATGGMVGELPQPAPVRIEPRNPYSDMLVRAALVDLARLNAPPAVGSAASLLPERERRQAAIGGEDTRLRRGGSRPR
jgi:hypothetical protein